MTIEGIDSRHTVSSSEHCTLPASNSFCPTRFQFEPYSGSSIEALHAVLWRLAGMDLPGKEHVEHIFAMWFVVIAGPGHCIA